jgi:radial spoke head protein 4A
MENDQELFDTLLSIKSKTLDINLYDFLQKLYETKVEMNNDKVYLDLFEDISARIKKDGTYFSEIKQRESLMKYLEEYVKNSVAVKNLLAPLAKPDDPTDLIQSVVYVPEYHSIFQSLEWTGVSVGEKESYLLTQSLKTLAFKKDLKKPLLFWGKIYGTEKDYYIAETTEVETGMLLFNVFRGKR